MRRASTLLGLLLSFLLVAAPGCGARKVRVTGHFTKKDTVQTFDEKDYVTLMFVPVDSAEGQQRSYSAKIDHASGSYEVEVLSGKYHISLYVPAPAPPGSKSSVVWGPPPTKRPAGAAANQTIYEFKSNTVLDIPVP
jgi:hypothetical protein